MRTLLEILSAAKVGEPTTHEECLYALLAVDSLSTFDTSAIRKKALGRTSRPIEYLAEDSHLRWREALNVSPKHYLGPNHDPARPEVQERVRASLRLLERVTKDIESREGAKA